MFIILLAVTEAVRQDMIIASHETESSDRDESEAYEKPSKSETSSTKKRWKSKGKMCSAINCYNYQQTCELPFFGFPKDHARYS